MSIDILSRGLTAEVPTNKMTIRVLVSNFTHSRSQTWSAATQLTSGCLSSSKGGASRVPRKWGTRPKGKSFN